MKHDVIDQFIDQLGRELPDVTPGAVDILGRIERLTLLLHGTRLSYSRDYGVSFAESDVLAALRLAGPPFELTPTVIAANVVITSGGMTKRLDRLEAAGLIERRPDPSDRRGSLIRLTDRGLKLIDEVLENTFESEARLVAGLTKAERETLASLLRKLLLSEPFASIDPARPLSVMPAAKDDGRPRRT
jgi:DNA-binding MarR family transcriptional regulator